MGLVSYLHDLLLYRPCHLPGLILCNVREKNVRFYARVNTPKFYSILRGKRAANAQKTERKKKEYGLRCITWAEAETEPEEAI